MASRPPGRPKARDPRSVKVTVRLTEREADLLQRLAKDDSLSAALRHVLDHYIRLMGGAALVRDTERALIRRALRTTKRLGPSETTALEALFPLDEPANDEASPSTTVPFYNPGTGKPSTITVTKVPDPNAGKTFVVPVHKPQAP